MKRKHLFIIAFLSSLCTFAQAPQDTISQEFSATGKTYDLIGNHTIESARTPSTQTARSTLAEAGETRLTKAYIQRPWQAHLDLSLTAGSTGIGFELSMPVNEYLKVRAGGTFIPKFKYPMTFTANIGEGDQMTADGLETRFERMAGMLEGFVGQPVDDKVDMIATPTMNQAKFMLDVTPFRNKSWHLTAGFYAGKSKVATCHNETHEITSLFAINLYNRLYDNNGEIALGFSVPPDILMQIMWFGRAGFPTGQYVNDIVYAEDVWVHDDFLDIDYIEHAKGDIIHAKGDTYMMAPSMENTAHADAFVNKFRPYFGVGYDGTISRDGRWKIGFDAGVMFWGGAPQLVDHAGVDLMYDVMNIGGQVGDYVELARHAKAFPVLELKLTHRIF